MEMRKAIYEFLLATLPAVVLYFIGWAYLYFFLEAFGISITELHLDTPTIFIYAFSPLQIALRAYGWWVLGGVLGLAFLLWVIQKMLPQRWSIRLRKRFKWMREKVAQLPPWVTPLSMLVTFFAVLLALVPLARWAADRQTMRVWASQVGYVIPLLAHDTKSQPATEESSPWHDSYKKCSEQEALLLIFSDDKAYYVLCKSSENSKEGYVFEIRRETWLSSVRFASMGAHE